MFKKNTCQNCAFLRQDHYHHSGDSSAQSWSREERIDFRPKYADQPGVSWSCHKGVWDKGVGLKRPLKEILLENRKNTCFYYPWKEGTGMLFQAAVELEKRQFEFRHLRLTRRISLTAIVIAVVTPIIVRVVFPPSIPF